VAGRNRDDYSRRFLGTDELIGNFGTTRWGRHRSCKPYSSVKESVMDNKDQVKGRMKQAVGDLTDNKALKKEGKTDVKVGRVKEVLQDTKNKADHAVDSVRDKLTHR
jgi:uncharacterized protein YjbJ (UPF0337 family)